MRSDSGDGSRRDGGRRDGEPIAIVGIGCRFPGGVRDLDSYGRLLASGDDVLRDVPADRWGPERCDPAGRPGSISNHRGAFLDDIDRFDAGYFGVAPREAHLLDPQHRLVLEVAWEAMSDSGRTRQQWAGSRTAVMIGLLANDYGLLHARTLGVDGITEHHIGGVEFSFAAGRLAYAFDLHGPVATVNSACSSSLLAVHQACLSLRAGDCDTAVAGGVSLVLTPDISVFLSRVGAISRSGRCRPFDAAADGIVRGEGCGIVVLKRLADAVAEGDRVYAVIRGSAANNDGRSMGLTMPNSAAQTALLREALSRARLVPHEVDYVEAHGTGTAIGDLIELDALGEVYAAGRDGGRPVRVGSHKAVLGHMDAAAGIGGLLKSVWVVASGVVPRQPHVDRLNPSVDWRRGALSVPLAEVRLDRLDRPARAGASAFGLSGTNVHVIVEAFAPAGVGNAPDGAGPAPVANVAPPARPPYVLLVSALDDAGLAAQLAGVRDRVAAAGDGELGDLLASAATRRTHETHRYAVVATDRDGLLAGLRGPAAPPEGAYTGVVEDDAGVPGPVFVYPGPGGQWPGMAVDLYDTDGSVRATLDECAAVIDAEASWSLLDELRRPAARSRLGRAGIAGPAVLAVQVALTRWLADRGVRPGAVLGHGAGEVVAACVAGSLSLADAVRVALRRAEIAGRFTGSGAAAAVQAAPHLIEPLLAELGRPVRVVAIDGPASVLVAGPEDELGATLADLAARGVPGRALPGGPPAGLPASAGTMLETALAGLAPGTPSRSLLSTVDPAGPAAACDAGYWARTLTGQRLFWPALDPVLAADEHPLVEIGPEPTLVSALADAARQRDRRVPVLCALRPDEPGSLGLHRLLARLHVAGTPVDWARVTGRPRRYRTLPVPSWRSGRYWLPGVARGEHRPAPATTPPATPATPATPAPERRRAAAGPLLDRVATAVRQVLGLPDTQPLARRRGLFEQGLDSLTAVGLRSRLEQEFAVTLPAPIVFERPTIAALAEYLAELGTAGTAATPAPAPVPAPASAPTPASVPAAPASAPTPARAAEPIPPAGAAEPIAVVGVACRLPGASSPAEFWDLLLTGTETAGEVPPGRRDDPMWAELGSQIPSRGSYLDDVAGFDAPFFRVSPREARLLDPQQRMFLEVAWDALEDAGCPADTLAGRPIGVYVGLAMADYQHLVSREMCRDARGLNLHHGTGTSLAALAGRLSYVLGLRGPSIAVDTACSASLTAVHLACQGLGSGDCEVAVVGGASAIVAPSPLMASMGASGALSLDGRCKAFDEDADGFGCGEGTVVLVLKPLSAARRAGDRVYAVLAGSAVNQDGATGGLTVPNAAAQVAVVRQALDRAGWAPHEVDYVETHGTGTPLGDPIEVRALADALGPGRTPDRPLLIGSAKANVGHLGAAAGAVGLLRVVLSMAHRKLPPHVVEEPTSRVEWDRLPVALVTEARDWPAGGTPARAGVSAFGFSGSNAHVLVEQAPPAAAEPAPAGPPYVLPVTAATPEALRAAADRLTAFLRAAPEHLDDLVFTTMYRRSLLEHRLAVTGVDADTLAHALARFAAGDTPDGGYTGQVADGDTGEVVFAYGGQPPPVAHLHRWSMRGSPYDRTLAELSGELAGIAGVDVDLWADPADRLRDAYLFCHQAAATAAWAALGVVPVAVTGAGCGAVAAAWAAGQLTTAQTLRLLVDGVTTPPTDQLSPARVPVVPAAGSPLAPVDVLLTGEPAGPDVPLPAPAVAALVVAGYRPVAAMAGRVLSLPGYPWEHRPYWYRELSPRPVLSWPFSAAAPDELRARVTGIAGLVRDGGLDAAAVATALAAEPAGPYRLVVTGADRAQLLAALDEHGLGERPGNLVERAAAAPTRTVLVFPGQGWQWAGMGLRLLDSCPAFAGAAQECSALIHDLTGWSVLDVLRGTTGAPSMDRVDVVQPVMFTVMVALARWWRSVGVEPDAVIGHSQGEIAAACVAGILDLPDAVRVVVARAAALTGLAGTGAMISVAADAATVRQRLAEGDRLSIAAVNGPSSIVLSGDPDAAEAFLAACDADGIRARRIPVDYASHSPRIDAIRAQLLERLGTVTPRPGRVPLYSTVTGTVADPRRMATDYWYENLRRPVLFDDTVRRLLVEGFTTFVECSAHPVLGLGISDTVDTVGAGAAVLETLRRDDDTPTRLQTAAAHAWTAGLPVDWSALLPAVAPASLPGRTAGPATVAARPAQGGLVERRFWQTVERGDADQLAETLNLRGGQQRALLGELLPALSTWWRQIREEAVTESWRYRTLWRPVEPTPPAHPGPWLVVVPSGLAGHDVVAGCVEALAGGDRKPTMLAVDPADEDLTGRLRAAVPDGDTGVGVLSLLAMDETPHPTHPVVPTGLAGTLRLVQALDRAGLAARLWTATSGAVAAGAEPGPSRPLQAHVWGLSRVVGLENPDRLGGLVDLPPVLDGAARARLRAALTGAGDEDQLAIRPDGLFVRRLVPAPLPQTAPAQRWRPTGTTLVTGGTGALGGHAARWLAHHGAPHLLLVSRHGTGAPGAADLRDELIGLGAGVTIAACDLADREALATVLAGIPADRPLTAVVHAAGVADDGPIADLTLDRLDGLLRPKTAAVRNLDELTRDLDLSAFVLFSSWSAVLPNVGQAGYAAANAHLDAVAAHRRAAGLPAVSVAWGAWAGSGMAGEEAFVDWIGRGGMDLITPHLAVTALQQALDHGDTTLVVANVDWQRFGEVFAATRPHPLVAEVLPEPAGPAAARPATVRPLDWIGELPAARREDALLDIVRTEVGVVLGHVAGQRTDPDQTFRDLGFDSVTAIELKNRLAASTGLRVSPTAIFDYPNPVALAQHLADTYEAQAPEPDSAGQPPTAATATATEPDGEARTEIDGMEIDDLVRMARGTTS